jgi:hypothetical protein
VVEFSAEVIEAALLRSQSSGWRGGGFVVAGEPPLKNAAY